LQALHGFKPRMIGREQFQRVAQLFGSDADAMQAKRIARFGGSLEHALGSANDRGRRRRGRDRQIAWDLAWIQLIEGSFEAPLGVFAPAMQPRDQPLGSLYLRHKIPRDIRVADLARKAHDLFQPAQEWFGTLTSGTECERLIEAPDRDAQIVNVRCVRLRERSPDLKRQGLGEAGHSSLFSELEPLLFYRRP
jgi:hypothetical protein